LSGAIRCGLFLLLAFGPVAFARSARADFYVIVQAENPQAALTLNEAVNLFMGRTRAFANGRFALVFDLARGNSGRTEFYRALTGMSLAQVNSYWARLMFAGQNLPPQPVPDESAMIDIVKRSPGGIGWISRAPTDKGVRALLVLKEP
jgi:hypothetical protein